MGIKAPYPASPYPPKAPYELMNSGRPRCLKEAEAEPLGLGS